MRCEWVAVGRGLTLGRVRVRIRPLSPATLGVPVPVLGMNLGTRVTIFEELQPQTGETLPRGPGAWHCFW